MLLANLMEKSEAGQFQLLTYLAQQTKPIPVKEAMARVGLSRSTLLKYVSAINQLAEDKGCQLEIELTAEENLQLQVGLLTSPQAIYALFLDNALKYQILMYLLRRHRFSIQQLATELLVSEATLNRHLAGLNQLLDQEFGLRIHNGSLRGPEQQVRYLYFLLLSQIWTKEQLERHCQQDHQKELHVVERLANIELDLSSRRNLQIWFYITKKRLAIKDKDFKELKNLMLPYADNVFYQRVELHSLRYFARYALELDEGEAMSLFACLVSFFVLPLHTMEFILGFGGPVMDQLTQSIRRLRTAGLVGDYTSEHVTYVLGQIFGQTYFFRGYLLQHEEQYSLDQLGLDQPYQGLVQHLLEESLAISASPALVQKLSWELGQTLVYVLEQESPKLRVALDIFGGEMTYYRIFTKLQKALEHNSLINLERYEAKKTYDLVISNQELRSYGKQAVYFLQDQLSPKDQQRIREWLME